MPPGLTNISLAMAVVSTFLTVYLSILTIARKEESLNEKLKRFTAWQSPQSSSPRPREWKELLQIAGRLAPKPLSKHLDKELSQAGVPLTGGEFLVLQLLGLLTAAFLGYLLIGRFIPSIIFSALGFRVPVIWLNGIKKRKQNLFNNQLADALIILANSLRSGFSLLQAMEMVSQEMPDPIASEFKQALREMTYGTATENALIHLAERVGSDDLDLMVTAVLIQRQVGGNLAEVLTNIHGTIQDRLRIHQEIKTLTAQGRTSGYIISALPFGLAGLLLILNPSYLKPLVTHPMGWLMLGMGIVLQVTGFITIKKIIDIKY